MPTGTLVSLPQSLSRSGNTLINLRGIVEGGKAFNYIRQQGDPSVANISRVTSSMNSNSAGWTSTIRYAFEPDAEGSFSYIEYGKLMSADTSFTILFRALMKDMVAPNTGWIFTNGDILSANGYAITYDPFASTINLAIAENVNYAFAFLTLNSSSILTNQWYHYGIRVTTSGGNTIVDWWENGGAKQTSSLGWQFVTPASGGTKLMNSSGNYEPFYGKLTDFAFLNGAFLTDSQMVAFASAPFV